MEPVQVLLAWALAAMTSWLPYQSHRGEPIQEVETRYESIARAAIAANYDPSVPPLWASRAASTILTLSVAKDESDFRADVFSGVGPKARGDQGRSYCVMQVQVADGSITVGDEEWTGLDLLADPNRCLTAGVQKLRGSLGACRQVAFRDRLSAYITGECKELNWQSRMRVDRAVEWLKDRPAPVRDRAVLDALATAAVAPAPEAKL